MPKEIERKYLVLQDLDFLNGQPFQTIVQGYLHEKGMTSRVRIVNDEQAVLTLKGPKRGLSRDEYEYPIPLQDARELMDYCGDHTLCKTRHEVMVGKHCWPVDVYQGSLEGLATAEIELEFEEEKFAKPLWLGPEVSDDKAYSNKNLARSKRAPLRKVG